MRPALILPEHDPEAVVDALVAAGYREEFCLSPSFDPPFVAALARAGFLVMSARLPGDGRAILLPKIHVERSILDFSDLHESRSALRLLPRYELRFDADFDAVLDACVETHGDDWLTAELVAVLRGLRAAGDAPAGDAPAARAGIGRADAGRAGAALPPGTARAASAAPLVRVVSFALHRAGRLVAGEFGTIVGGVYTSYSGFRAESSAGTVQLILTGRFLRDAGFAFWDLGMPLPYKVSLGSRTVDTAAFVERFRKGRELSPRL